MSRKAAPQMRVYWGRRLALALVSVVALSACASEGRDEACKAVNDFLRSTSNPSLDFNSLANQSSRLASDLATAADQTRDASLRRDIESAAGAALIFSLVAQEGPSSGNFGLESDIFLSALNDLRVFHC